MTPLPAWIDPDSWQGFATMRKKLRKPMTPRAEGMILAELYRLKSAGHDPNAALQQSELHCWLDVYAPRTRSPVQAHAVSFYEAEQAAKSARVAEMTGGLVSANLPGFGDVIENQARIAS